LDEAERWLRENDPDFKKYTVRRNSEYPFHTARQEFLRNQKEIPVSNLTAVNHRIGLSDFESVLITRFMK
jgi:hypothetical protein